MRKDESFVTCIEGQVASFGFEERTGDEFLTLYRRA